MAFKGMFNVTIATTEDYRAYDIKPVPGAVGGFTAPGPLMNAARFKKNAVYQLGNSS